MTDCELCIRECLNKVQSDDPINENKLLACLGKCHENSGCYTPNSWTL